MILKKTVRIVNSQTKSYFVNKLQGYDEIIAEKENKLQEIDELIKDREKGIKEDNNKDLSKGGYAFDPNVIDLLNETKYQDKNVLEINKLIDENRDTKNFGNARFIRNVFEKTVINHAKNTKNNKRKDILITITKKDITL